MIVSVLWNYDFKFPNLITNSLSTGMSLYWIGTKFCVIDICDTDICDKRNSGIYLMTDPSAQGYPSLADGRTDRKISRTQETLHSCQSWNDQKPIGNHSPDFSVILAFWRICWWARGGLRGSRRQSWAGGRPLLRRRVLESICKSSSSRNTSKHNIMLKPKGSDSESNTEISKKELKLIEMRVRALQRQCFAQSDRKSPALLGRIPSLCSFEEASSSGTEYSISCENQHEHQ